MSDLSIYHHFMQQSETVNEVPDFFITYTSNNGKIPFCGIGKRKYYFRVTTSGIPSSENVIKLVIDDYDDNTNTAIWGFKLINKTIEEFINLSFVFSKSIIPGSYYQIDENNRNYINSISFPDNILELKSEIFFKGYNTSLQYIHALAENRENQLPDMECIVNLTGHRSWQQSGMRIVHLPCNHPFFQSGNLRCD
jgi:hypothetical protein